MSTPEGTRTTLRPGLPPPPPRIAALPLDARGYPIPWFVAWVDGKPDFRIAESDKRYAAVRFNKCWICGEHLGANKAFVAGPMCAVNRTSSEPPAHRDCAVWAVQACPFLVLPRAARRDAGMTPDLVAPAPGEPLLHNPGACMVWVCHEYKLFKADGGGWLFRMGDPHAVLWYAEGQPATRAPVIAAFEKGLPSLVAMCEGDATSLAELEMMAMQAMAYVPQE